MKFNLIRFYTKEKERYKLFLTGLSTNQYISNSLNFIIGILGYGILINYMIWGIFHIPFTWYSFPAYGILYYFITEEFMSWFRRIIARR